MASASCQRSPMTRTTSVCATMSPTPRCVARSCERETASATTSPTSTSSRDSMGSSDCSRDRSMIWLMSSANRAVSRWSRPEKRSTASGSSRAAANASDSTLMAPMGVFSSWEMLATKSRRTASTRRSPDSSTPRTSTRSFPRGRTCAATSSRSVPGWASLTMVPSNGRPDARTSRTVTRSSGKPTRLPRARLSASPASFTTTISSCGPTSRAPSRSVRRIARTSSATRAAACWASSLRQFSRPRTIR